MPAPPRVHRTPPGLGLCAVALLGCHPYQNRDGEFFAGSVDPARFPAPYLGQGGNPARAGSGTFTPVRAYALGRATSYHAFPLPAAQAAAKDPLLLAPLSPALAYVFDPGAERPYPQAQRCAPRPAPYDRRADAFRPDEQYAIFTALPSDARYVPIVAQVPVESRGHDCQSLKSDEAVVGSEVVSLRRRPPTGTGGTGSGAMATGEPDGRYLVWPIIDPAADVRLNSGQLDPRTGLGPQRFGWFERYLLAYLDGGYLPLDPAAPPTAPRARAQRLYYPTAVAEPRMGGAFEVVPGRRGAGFDVLEAIRGEDGYSPLCEVFTYVPADPQIPARDARDIDPMTVKPDARERFVYCPQLEGGPT